MESGWYEAACSPCFYLLADHIAEVDKYFIVVAKGRKSSHLQTFNN